jgi:hypothetical protein
MRRACVYVKRVSAEVNWIDIFYIMTFFTAIHLLMQSTISIHRNFCHAVHFSTLTHTHTHTYIYILDIGEKKIRKKKVSSSNP